MKSCKKLSTLLLLGIYEEIKSVSSNRVLSDHLQKVSASLKVLAAVEVSDSAIRRRLNKCVLEGLPAESLFSLSMAVCNITSEKAP